MLSRESSKNLSAKQLKQEDSEVSGRQSGPGGLRWMSFGIELAGVVAIFVYGGYLADGYFGTRPWLMIVGLSVSFIGMIYQLFKETKKWRQ
jgi:F0F1-type ATP synthase assembly protein I